jgi:hypothetical protein
LYIAALVAALPFLVDTFLNSALPLIHLVDWDEKEGSRNFSLRYIIPIYAAGVGGDALAGYTFARVAENYG